MRNIRLNFSFPDITLQNPVNLKDLFIFLLLLLPQVYDDFLMEIYLKTADDYELNSFQLIGFHQMVLKIHQSFYSFLYELIFSLNFKLLYLFNRYLI